MKKSLILVYCLIIANNILIAEIEEEYILDTIDERFIGAYLPIEFLFTLEKTKHYAAAMKYNMKSSEDYATIFYEHIVVYENEIRYTELYADGFRNVSMCGLPNYQFEYIKDDEILIIDPNGNKYKKITDSLNDYEIIIGNYLGKIILNEILEKGEMEIEGNIITIPSLDNKKYRIETLGYLYPEHCNLYLKDCETEWPVYLEIESSIYTIYDIEYNRRASSGKIKKIIWKKEI
jgi:hypothetical protein